MIMSFIMYKKAGSVTALNQRTNRNSFPAPALIAAAGDRAAYRFLEFFTAQIRNPNTRRAYARAVSRFFSWCDERAIGLDQIAPVTVAAYIEQLPCAKPTVKQRLAAVRMLLDWLATGGVLPFNPATAVRGPKHVVKRGKTPVLAPDEARAILDAIDPTTPIGLRDRALIGLMVYTFARICEATSMRVEDVFVKNRRLWVRVHEKGGKAVSLPCHHNLESYLHAYLDGTGIAADPSGPLFRTVGGRLVELTRTALDSTNAYRMVQRRAEAAGIATKIGNHTFRATGITAYLTNGGTLEKAASIANHASTRTTQLYDRRSDDVNLDEIERILI